MKEARASFIRLLLSTVFTVSFKIKLFSSLLLSSASFDTVKRTIDIKKEHRLRFASKKCIHYMHCSSFSMQYNFVISNGQHNNFLLSIKHVSDLKEGDIICIIASTFCGQYSYFFLMSKQLTLFKL